MGIRAIVYSNTAATMKSLIIVVAFLAGIAFDDVQGCGAPQVISPRVIAGSTARRGAWPWQVLMKFRGQPGCGGSLVAPNWVVTAAHCVYGKEWYPNMFTVTVGEHDRNIREGSEVEIRVSEVHRHPSYNPSRMSNDLAMLKLSQPAQYNQYVQAVCLPSGNVQPGSVCTVTGWGKVRHPGQMYHVLQQANLPVPTNQECDAYNYRTIGLHVGPSMVCGGDHGATRKSACHGDSGGPFVCNVGGRWELHGAVSHGSTTCSSQGSFSVFSRVWYNLNWVRQTMGGY